jgi:NAD(P)-dependent dehydrogenase (short-subunit alcohol dehydrogenase family)
VSANAAAIGVARIGEATQEHLHKALPLLNDGGSIILNSSDTNAEGNDGNDVYAATTAALRSSARTWASKLRDRNIRVGVISPDAIEATSVNTLAGTLDPGPNAAEEPENYQHRVAPPARYATAEEVANAAVFLASDQTKQPHHRRRRSRRRRHQPGRPPSRGPIRQRPSSPQPSRAR